MQDLFKQLQDSGQLEAVAQKAGVSVEELQRVMAVGIPTVTTQLERNAEDEAGAEALGRALDDHENDNPYEPVGFLDQFLGGGEGGRMVDHIFPNNRSQVEDQMAQKTGLDNDKIRRILSIVAPLVLAHMASKWSKNKRQQQVEPQTREIPNQRGNSPIQMPDLRTGNRADRVREVTRQSREEAEAQTGGSLFDMAKDILQPGSGRQDGGILGDLLGGIFGKR